MLAVEIVVITLSETDDILSTVLGQLVLLEPLLQRGNPLLVGQDDVARVGETQGPQSWLRYLEGFQDLSQYIGGIALVGGGDVGAGVHGAGDDVDVGHYLQGCGSVASC